jgi:hypothetical protein
MTAGQLTVGTAQSEVLPTTSLRPELLCKNPAFSLGDRLPCHFFGYVEPFSMHALASGTIFPLSVVIELPMDKLLDSTSETYFLVCMINAASLKHLR